MNVIPLPRSGADLLAEYQTVLARKNPATVDAYMRALRQLTGWLAERPGAGGRFFPEQFTRTAMEGTAAGEAVCPGLLPAGRPGCPGPR